MKLVKFIDNFHHEAMMKVWDTRLQLKYKRKGPATHPRVVEDTWGPEFVIQKEGIGKEERTKEERGKARQQFCDVNILQSNVLSIGANIGPLSLL